MPDLALSISILPPEALKTLGEPIPKEVMDRILFIAGITRSVKKEFKD